MQRAYLFTEDGGKKEVFLLDEKDLENTKEFKKTNLREHLYMGYLIIGSIAFGLGILISWKRLKGE